MFKYINRDHILGAAVGVALLVALLFVTGCNSEEVKDTSDTDVTDTEIQDTDTETGDIDTGTDTGSDDTGTDTDVAKQKE